MSASVVHEIGLQEVARIQSKMRDITQELGFEGKLSLFMQVIDSLNYMDVLTVVRWLFSRRCFELFIAYSPQKFAEQIRA